jgi:RNA polymerase sigma factor (sigma-70 family)
VRTEDGYIISKCLNGEPEAFGFLVDKYKESVYAFAYAKLRNFHDAEDVAQEVFIKAYQKLHTLRHWDSFLAWLYSITSNLCKMQVRSQSKRPDNEAIEDQKAEILAVPAMNSYREKLVNESVHEALDTLPDIHRQILTLHYLGGMKVNEISRFLGIPLRTTARRLSEGKSQLKEEVLGIMITDFGSQKLPVGFTLRITDIVSRIRVQPFPPTKALPLGLSLAAGIIIAFLGLGTYFNFPNLSSALLTSMSKNKMPLLGDIPIFMSNTPQLYYASLGGGDSNGSGVSSQQDAALLAPKGEGGKIPDKPSAQLGKGRNVYATYSSDGKLFIVVEGSIIKLYNADNLNEVGALQSNSGIYCLALSPDGKVLASGGSDQLIHLWDIQERKEIGILEGHSGYIYSVNFSPDGKTLASCGYDKSIRLWDVKERKQLSVSGLDIDYAVSVAFSPDGKLLASSGWQGENAVFQLWNVREQGKLELAQRIDGINCFAFNPDGKVMVLGTRNDNEPLRIWDIDTKKQIGEVKGGIKSFNCIIFSPDGKLLAFADYGGSIYLWDMLNQKQVGVLNGHKNWISSLSFTPDGKTLASNSPGDKNIIIWDVESQKQVNMLDGYTSYVESIALSPNSKILASVGYESVCLWDIKEQKQICELQIPNSNVDIATFSPDGKLLAIGYESGEIHLWDVQEQKDIGVLKGHQDSIRSLAFSPDGKMLVSGSFDKTVHLWNINEQKEIKKIICPSHTHSVAFSPDGKILASSVGGECAVYLWDVSKNFLQIGTLQGDRGMVGIAFSPNGEIIACADVGNTIVLWNVKDKIKIGGLWGNFWRGFDFSPDGKWIASVSYDQSQIYLWDVAEQKKLATLSGHAGSISWVAFSPDGKWLVSSGGDGTIQLWEVDIPVEGKAVNPMGKAIDTWGEIKATDLFQNFPNPFNPETWIPFCLSESENVKIKIYSLKGELVKMLDLGRKQAGQYLDREKAAYWDGRNEAGEMVASNIYFYVMQAGKYTESKKMILIR